MFEEQKVITPSDGQAAPSKSDDVVIHVMPKDFMGKEPAPAPVKAALPIPPVPETPVPAPVLPPPSPAPKPVIEKPRSQASLLIGFLLVLLLLIGGGVAGYIFVVQPLLNQSPVVPTPTPTPTPEPVPEPVPEPAEPTPGTDTDSDGLTNVEELLYGTDYRDPDTDKDTFLDGNEIFHRYHPNGSAPQTLLDTGAVRVFQTLEIPFSVYYPSSWTPVALATESRVTFRSPSTASIAIAWEGKTGTLDEWYEEHVDESDLKPIMTKEGLNAYSNREDRLAYVDGGGRVYIFTYDLGDAVTIEFLQTFQMMVNSLRLLP